jgi:hypothetical protein
MLGIKVENIPRLSTSDPEREKGKMVIENMIKKK